MLEWDALGLGEMGTLVGGVLCQMPPIGDKIAGQGGVKAEQNLSGFWMLRFAIMDGTAFS